MSFSCKFFLIPYITDLCNIYRISCPKVFCEDIFKNFMKRTPVMKNISERLLRHF